MATNNSALLGELLKAVSRSFYLTLRVLPNTIRRQIGLAYLLARATDTIADTDLIPVAERLQALDLLRGRILGTTREALNFGELTSRQGVAAEKILLERVDEAIGILESLPVEDQQSIRKVLEVITSGQELDLQRSNGASKENIVALKNADELDDYTYRVAGCVGEFWTRVCRRHEFPKARLDDAWLIEQGIRFGKGLQLVNILRDLPVDLRNGRCYLPLDELTQAGLQPQELLDEKNHARLRPVFEHHLDVAEAHLRAGWEYTNALPRSSVRVRLACAWPLLIGIKTLEKLRATNPCDPNQRVKVGRGDVKSILWKSVWSYPFGRIWKEQFPGSRSAV